MVAFNVESFSPQTTRSNSAPPKPNQSTKLKMKEIIFSTKPNFSNKIKQQLFCVYKCVCVCVCVCVRQRERERDRDRDRETQKLRLHLEGNTMLRFSKLHRLCLCYPIVGLLTYEYQISRGIPVWQNWILLSSTHFCFPLYLFIYLFIVFFAISWAAPAA